MPNKRFDSHAHVALCKKIRPEHRKMQVYLQRGWRHSAIHKIAPLRQPDEGERRVKHMKYMFIQRMDSFGDGRSEQARSLQEGEGIVVARAPHHRIHLPSYH